MKRIDIFNQINNLLYNLDKYTFIFLVRLHDKQYSKNHTYGHG